MIGLLRRNGDFRAVFLAQIVSYCGDWFATVAMLGLVIDRTGSNLAGAAVLVVQSLPIFLLSPLAGPAADRIDRRLLMMVISLLLVFVLLYGIALGTEAQTLGQVTFSISYVVIIVRGRLLSIGPEYEEAARDLGASQLGALRLVLLPLLYPAIFAGFIVVFALSIDDFVVTQYMSSGQSTQTVPILIYGAARGATTPALNAVATVMVVATLLSVGLAYFVYRWSARSQPATSGNALNEIAALEM